jgi:hypothetical protein
MLSAAKPVAVLSLLMGGVYTTAKQNSKSQAVITNLLLQKTASN